MTNEEFKQWRTSMGYSQTEAAEALGLSRGSVINYERGSRAEDDRPALVPRTVSLACAALQMHLLPLGEERTGTPKNFRIIISAANDPDRFTHDSIVHGVVDEHQAVAAILKRTRPSGDESLDRPTLNLRVIRD